MNFWQGARAPLSAVSLDSTNGRFEGTENGGHMGLPTRPPCGFGFLKGWRGGPRYVSSRTIFPTTAAGCTMNSPERGPYQIRPAYDGMTVEL